MNKTVMICLLLLGLQILLPIQSPMQAKQSNEHFVNNAITTNVGTDTSAFLSTWNTSAVSSRSSNANQITLPLYVTGNYNFLVQWGDGSQNTISSNSQATHTYIKPGVYNLNITGLFDGWQFPYNSNDANKLLQIAQWGNIQLGNTGSYFNNALNLNLTATDALNLTGTTNLGGMFSNCPNLGSSGNINNWDVSQVTNMARMFAGDSAFNLPIDNWDTAQVTNMGAMFYGTNVFNQPIGNWDVSQVTDMSGMFSSALSFNQPLNNWDTSHVTNMQDMFYGAWNFNQPLNNWDVSHVTNMQDMFGVATVFNQPIGNWNVSQVTDMSNMFDAATAFNQPLDNWNVSQVTNMYWMFYYDHNFNQSLNNWDVSHVTNMEMMFRETNYFNQPLNNWNVSQVTTMSMMFYEAYSFNQPLNSWDVHNVSNMDYMFFAAKAFNQNLGGWNVSNLQLANNIFNQTNLSISNYSNLLISWSKLNLQQNVIFNAGSLYYSSNAITSKQFIINTFNWTITDGGLVIGPTTPLTLKITSGYGSLSLSWSAPTKAGNYTITYYKIYRSEQSNSGFKLIGTTSKLTFTDTGLTSGVKYYYIVEASNKIISGTNSTVISGTPSGTASSASSISQGKSSPLSLVGVILGFAIIASLRVIKHRKKYNK